MSSKFLGWTYFGDSSYSSIGDLILDCVDFRTQQFKDAESKEKREKLIAISEECYDVLVKRCKEKGIKFDGGYHQNGDYGCPVFETEFGALKDDFTFRAWGQVMADAGFAKSYIDWAWNSPGKSVMPNEVEDKEFLLFESGFVADAKDEFDGVALG